MIDALFSQTNYAAMKKLMDATALQHQALASNLANVNQPGYKRMDVDAAFGTQLKQAMQSQDATQIGSLHPTLAPDPNAPAQSRDGNNVQMEKELMKMTENTVAHALESQLITGQLLRLRLAITGRPS